MHQYIVYLYTLYTIICNPKSCTDRGPRCQGQRQNWAFLWYSHNWFIQKLWVPRGVFFGFVFSWCLIFICSFVLLFLFFKNEKSSPPAICPGLDDVPPVIWNIWTLRSIFVTRKPQLNRLIRPTRAWLLSANGNISWKWESGLCCVTQHSRKWTIREVSGID